MKIAALSLIIYAVNMTAQVMPIESAPTGECTLPDRDILQKVVDYTEARFSLTHSPQVTIDRDTPHPDCYVGITLTGLVRTTRREFSLHLYLTPDFSHLVNNPVDLSIPPSQVVAEEAHRLSRTTLDGAKQLTGRSSAPIKVVIFSDFECPYCARAWNTAVQSLIASDPQDVAIYYRSMPLTSAHPWAKSAALIAECAYEQSPMLFREFARSLYRDSSGISLATLDIRASEYLAEAPAFDKERFQACRSSQTAARLVQADIDSARQADVRAVPTFFINGVRQQGVITPDQLRQLIDHARSELASKPTARVQ